MLNKKNIFIISIVSVAILLAIVNFSLTINDNEKKEAQHESFPDHTVIEKGFEAEYPAPVKQLQQVLTHSYVNEPSDEVLNIDVSLKELSFESSSQPINDEIIEIQSQIDALKEAMDRANHE